MVCTAIIGEQGLTWLQTPVLIVATNQVLKHVTRTTNGSTVFRGTHSGLLPVLVQVDLDDFYRTALESLNDVPVALRDPLLVAGKEDALALAAAVVIRHDRSSGLAHYAANGIVCLGCDADAMTKRSWHHGLQ